MANDSFSYFFIIACLFGVTSLVTVTSFHYSVPQE